MAVELVTNLALEAEPVAPAHVVNIAWVREFVAGRIKIPVRTAATTNQIGTYVPATHTFNYTAAGPVTISTVAVAVGDRVLLAGQTNAAHNGVYDVLNAGDGGPGQLRRSNDFDAGTKIFNGISIAVNDGTYDNRTFKLTCDEPVVLDSTALHFALVTTTSTGAEKFAEAFDASTGTAIAGGGMSWAIDHQLGTEEVAVELWNLDTKGMVFADVEITDDDTVTIKFDQAPAASKHYQVVVIG